MAMGIAWPRPPFTTCRATAGRRRRPTQGDGPGELRAAPRRRRREPEAVAAAVEPAGRTSTSCAQGEFAARLADRVAAAADVPLDPASPLSGPCGQSAYLQGAWDRLLRCPEGHALRLREADGSVRRCALCGSLGGQGQTWRCSPCHYDMCWRCIEVLLANAMAVSPCQPLAEAGSGRLGLPTPGRGEN